MPIIACTANALGTEAEVCFSAGMDDYLAKPTDIAQLVSKLDQWLPLTDATTNRYVPNIEVSEVDAIHIDGELPIDHSVLSIITQSSKTTESEVIKHFRYVNDADAAKLIQAVSGNNILEIMHTAHRIKGASRLIGATALAHICDRIEQASRVNDKNKTIVADMTVFQRELERLNAYFDIA